MAIYGGTGVCIGYGNDYQVSSDTTVINNSGEVYVPFKIPLRSNTTSSNIDPNQTLAQAITDLGGDDSDDTLYGANTLSSACQILVTMYGNYYHGVTARMFNIQTHHTDQANPNARVKITTVWSNHWRSHSGWNTGDTYPRITSSNTATGEFLLNPCGDGEPDYFGSNDFEIVLLNGSTAAPYVGNQTYDSRYGQDQAWK
tara:strand:+ start:189 stop:788 length:600 start_codon:yes stop_codon:yes gene_type:complete